MADLDNMSSLVISLITSNTDLMPDVMLSRWWKRKSEDMSTKLFPSESQRELCCNPRTKLHKIARYGCIECSMCILLKFEPM